MSRLLATALALALLVPAPAAAKKIFLNPSDQSNNAVSGGGTEDTYAIDNANRASGKIQAAGIETKIVKGMGPACDAANAWGADIFVSIHSNAGGGHGTETFHYPGSSSGNRLAGLVQNALIARYNVGNRGVKSADFYVLRNTNMVAVLTETVFHDCSSGHSFPIGSMSESAFLRNAGGRELMASGIADGSCDYFGVTCPPSCQPSAEVCDGKDNDCNGQVDENDPGGNKACDTGKPGICAPGVTHCRSGKIQCDAYQAAQAETCNSKDDNCNGQVDDGNPGGGAACNTGKTGACAAGAITCQGGALGCAQTVQPSTEACNGKDDDCDGQVDEDNPGGNQACDTGKPGACAAGTSVCAGGKLQCNQKAQPGEELCNGKDDDCDGQTDEGDPSGGQACQDPEKKGVCGEGVNHCQGGRLVCVTSGQPSDETCDGKDNDCDGEADEGDPGGGAECTTPLAGPCSPGLTLCSEGGLGCKPLVEPQPEACDGVDNDCDGVVDDDACTVELTAGCGCSAGAESALAWAALACAGLRFLRRRRG